VLRAVPPLEQSVREDREQKELARVSERRLGEVAQPAKDSEQGVVLAGRIGPHRVE
jgi:hypothetical protein